MRDALAFLQEVDLGRQGLQWGQLLHNGDPWLLGIIVSLLVCLGHKLAIGHRLVYGWGLRLAALTFIGYGGYALFQAGGLTEAPASAVLSRSAIVAGSVLALSWILLPFILFVYGNFRFGLAGFLAYAGYGLLTAESWTTEALPGLGLRALLVAGLAMVLAWILRPIWEFLAARWPARPQAPPAKPAAEASDAEARLSRRQRKRARRQARQAEAQAASAGLETTSSLEIEYRCRRDRAPQRNPVSFNLEELHGWFLEEQLRIQELLLDAPARQAKLLALQEFYVSLSQRFLGEPTLAVGPMLGRRQPDVRTESLVVPEHVGAPS
jgi:hypothetical protein